MLCCVCLLENPKCLGIFNDKGQEMKVAEIIQKYLWFKPEPENFLTREICTTCWYKINDFHIFYQNAEKAHKEYEYKVKFNIKNEMKLDQDNEISNKNENQLEENTTPNPFSEIHFIDEFETNNPLDKEINNDDPFNHETDEDEYKFSDKYEEEDYLGQQSALNEKELLDDKEDSSENGGVRVRKRKKTRNKCALNKATISSKKRMINHFDHEEMDKIVKKHIPIGCNLCVFVGITFSDVIEHFKEAHPKLKPYIMCCDRKLRRRCDIVQHALKHENPKVFSCKDCNKSFTTSKGLVNHNMRYHPQEEDLVYKCDQCSEKFARKYILEYHKNSHIPKEEWQYFCKICPTKRAFASLNLLNIHISMRHKREKNICPVCARQIKDKKSFEKHVRSHHEDSGPRLKCTYDGCDSWLKDEDNLRQHLKRHNPEGIIHKCDQCDKECTNRRALTNHKRYAHSNEIYQCEQCEKTFKKAISLREHITQHTGETLYKCPFCVKTFNSNANMHSHKKKMHPIEWNEWRKNKRCSAQKLINSTNPLNQIDETSNKFNKIINFF